MQDEGIHTERFFRLARFDEHLALHKSIAFPATDLALYEFAAEF